LIYAGGVDLKQASRLTWFNRSGKTLDTLGDPAAYVNVALSPDESRAAVGMMGGAPRNSDVWILDVTRGVSSRLTFSAANELVPIWSPDGARVAFTSIGSDPGGLRVKVASGTTSEESLLARGGQSPAIFPEDWSSDDRFVLYSETTTVANALDLMILPLFGERKPFPYVQDPSPQAQASFAPDARWIAYTSDESGIPQVYVQPFPATGGKSLVSKNGGTQPQWRRDGKELFFLALDGALMAVPIDTSRQFDAGTPQSLFATGISAAAGVRRQYAVARDGKRFLIIVPDGGANEPSLTVVVNWLAAVQK
jgi:Tol biopolymer transport system component